MEARPSRVVTICACDDPRRTGSPFSGTRANVVLNVTLTPITGFAASEPSLTSMASG